MTLTFLAPVNFQKVKHSPPTPTIAKRLPIARALAASLVPPSSSATSPIWAFSKTLGSCFLADMTVLLNPATIDTPAIPVRKAAAENKMFRTNIKSSARQISACHRLPFILNDLRSSPECGETALISLIVDRVSRD